MTPTFGTVNNLLLVTGPKLLPTTVSPEPLGLGANMDVDHDVIQRMEPIQSILDIEIEVSRRRISDFLSARTAYDLLPESGKVCAYYQFFQRRMHAKCFGNGH